MKWKNGVENGEFEMMKFRSESGGEEKQKQKAEMMGKVVIALL